MDVTKYQFKRINAFQGLVIDADIWQEAHDYHRNQQRLHLLAFHKTGIISGLEVTANKPPDLSVTINPGIAADPEGNIIIVSQKQRYRLQTREKGLIYLTIQFRDIPSEPYQPPEGGQPTRILEAYRVQEREKLPDEPYVELARLDFDPGVNTIKDAKNPASPGVNEINLRFREEAAPAKVEPAVRPAPAPETRPAPAKARVPDNFMLGHAVLGQAEKGLHVRGLNLLAREVARQTDFVVNVEENINLSKNLSKYSMIYFTGQGSFTTSPEQQASLAAYIRSGGFLFGEGCSSSSEAKGAREFGLAFNQLAGQLESKLGMVQCGHELLSCLFVFSESPPGREPAMLMEGGNIVYSGSDYGCAWEGGSAEQPLSREVIRAAFEMGVNIVVYAKELSAGR
jgi:hypothetical protein